MIGRWAGMFRPISSDSISTCTIFALGLNVLPQPIYKLNLTPSNIIRSASEVIFLKPFKAEGLACPKQFLCLSDSTPRPKLRVNV